MSEKAKSLLCKFYGVYTFQSGNSNIHFLLMENLEPIDNKLFKYKFDLKGSIQGRKTKDFLINKEGKTLKDRDFLLMKKAKPTCMKLSRAVANDLMELIKSDLKIIEENKLMDYSLF